MQTATFDGFWSYTHDDDQKSGGRVTSVAEALQNEFSVLTGDDLQLFIDRKSIKWGDAWRDAIESAIGEVPFFIPIVTPKFMKSEECRRELLKFSREAKGRGFDTLLLPILYIPVVGLTEDNPDEVYALLARTQYFDWTPFRLLSPTDPKVLQAIHDLARRLEALKAEAQNTSLTLEDSTASDELSEIDTTVEQILDLLPSWMESVDFDRIAGRHWETYREERINRVNRLIQTKGSQGAIVSTLVKLGQELLPIANDRLDKAKRYTRLSIELDPLVAKAVRLIALHPEKSPLLDRLRDGVREAFLNIEPAEDQAHDWRLHESITATNKHLEEAAETMRDSFAYTREGNEIVETWRDKLATLDGHFVIQGSVAEGVRAD